MLGVRRLELADVAVHEGGGLVEVAAAADEVDERVGVVLALADGLGKNEGTAKRSMYVGGDWSVRGAKRS